METKELRLLREHYTGKLRASVDDFNRIPVDQTDQRRWKFEELDSHMKVLNGLVNFAATDAKTRKALSDMDRGANILRLMLELRWTQQNLADETLQNKQQVNRHIKGHGISKATREVYEGVFATKLNRPITL